ncbi:MarR family winged helix-turn-helix transcriptional regulator [Alkalihalobacillus sp. AL-G]|uniref:MarR family winged helix-turn-helix transcriptional regulator n=1 Tax=Alkalihalobacillus sp. AL-G TaxID=2926399 RepID=UPI00272C7289|nr:MarR family transcriptional regulator [Alkalihalobacillus sp. AL-G]WLD95434.1 MarR family transcriptional regulator [Alkalihalobacillus sp. AL-G]
MIAGHIKQKGREILNDFSITPPQFIALQWLFEENEMTIGDLSNKMYLAYSTTTDLIDRMEKNGLVKRVRDSNDRRVVRIQKLDKGYEIIQEVIKRRQKYLEQLTGTFSDGDINNLQECLHLLYDEMNKHDENQTSK